MTTREFQSRSLLQIFVSYFKPHRRLFFLDMACALVMSCLLYTSDAADERSSVNLGGRRIIKKKR